MDGAPSENCQQGAAKPGPNSSDYWELLKLHNSNRIDYNHRKWETLKFFQAFYTALMIATVVATVTAADRNLLHHFQVRLVLILLALFGGACAYVGRINLRRESRLLFLEEAQMFKMAYLLNLNQYVDKKDRWLVGDEHLLMSKWRNPNHGAKGLPKNPTLDDWVDRRTRQHYFADLFSALFVIGIILSFILAGVIYFYPNPVTSSCLCK